MIITAIKARKLLSEGCIGVLAYVVSKTEIRVRIEETPIIQEFSNVFLKELLGLGLKQKIKLSIKLVLGTTLISKALYRITTTKLQKLKKQL